MKLSRDQVNVIIKNGQDAGLTGKEVLDGLIERGYEPEGIDITQAKQSILSEKQQLDRGFDTKTDIQQTGQGIKESIQKRLSNIDTIREAQKSGEQSGVRSVLQTAGQVAGGISDIIGETVVGAGKTLLPQQAEEKVASTVKAGIERGMERGQEVPRESLLSRYEELKQTNPKAARDVEALLGFGSLALDVGTAGLGGEAAKTGVKAGKKAIQETIQTTTEASGKFANSLVGKTLPESSEIMNRVARLKPTDANKFKTISGKTQGEYLAETGNFGTPDEIIKKEAEKFTQSKLDVDNTLASLPGNYNDGSIQDALNGLLEKAKLESGENIKAPYLDRAIELQNKSQTEGLTMSEINELKRLYEKNVRLGYNKLTDSTKINQATNIDTALRQFQFNKAKELGFENLDELNKQTQISKFIIDKLGDQVVGQSGLNNVSLTDWILLSGGDPTAVGGFLTKKFFGSKAIQSKIAKMLNKGETKGQIKPILKINSTNNLDSSLIEEARKYKSAEEFVKAQGTPVYHGTSKEAVGSIEKGGFKKGKNGDWGAGIYTTKNKISADMYGDTFGGKTLEVFIPENKIYEYKDFFLNKEKASLDLAKKIIENKNVPETLKSMSAKELADRIKNTFSTENPAFWLEKAGYKGIKDTDKIVSQIKDEIVIFNPESIKTKSQLEDIWKKATRSKQK